MRENRSSGSEGGGAESNRLFLPLYRRDCAVDPKLCRPFHGLEPFTMTTQGSGFASTP
jgi:hypothetical protein